METGGYTQADLGRLQHGTAAMMGFAALNPSYGLRLRTSAGPSGVQTKQWRTWRARSASVGTFEKIYYQISFTRTNIYREAQFGEKRIEAKLLHATLDGLLHKF